MGGIYGGYLQGQALQQQLQQGALAIRERQAQLDQQKQRLAAAAAAFQGLAGDQQAAPVPGALAQGTPQAAPPQNPVQPMAPGQPSLPNRPQAPGGAQPGAMPPPAAPQALAPQLAAPGAPQGVQGPFQILGAMARQLKQANPGVDPVVLADALQQQVALMRGVQPEMKDQLNAVINQQKIDLQIQKLQQTGEYQQMLLELRRQGLDQRMAELTLRERVADMQDATRQRGQDIASGDRAAGRATTERGQDLRATESGLKTEHQAGIDQIRAINSDISDLLHGRTESDLTPAEKQQLTGLQTRRAQVTTQLVQGGLAKPEIAKQLRTQGATAPKPAADTEQPPQDASQLPEGTKASNGTDSYVVQSGKWVKQ